MYHQEIFAALHCRSKRYEKSIYLLSRTQWCKQGRKGKKKGTQSSFSSWPLFGWLQTYWNQTSRLCYTDKPKNGVLGLLATRIYVWVSIVENQSTDCTILGESLLLEVRLWWLHGRGNQRSNFVQYLRWTRRVCVAKSALQAMPAAWTVGLYVLQLLWHRTKRTRAAVSCANHSLLLFQA